MNRKCSACDIMIDINNYKKDGTVCKSCYNINKRKNNNNTPTLNKINTSYQQPNIENVNNKKKLKINNNKHNNPNLSTYENCANVVFAPRNVVKTYYMLKVLEKISNQRPINIINRSPNQNPNYKTNTEIKPINKYKGSVVIFDDMLGAKNSSQIDEFFTRGRHEDLDVYYISQSCFALPRQSVRNNSDRLILFKQTLRDDKVCVMIVELLICYKLNLRKCVELLRAKILTIYVLIWLKIKKKVYIVFSTKVKLHISFVFPKLNLFSFLNDVCDK